MNGSLAEPESLDTLLLGEVLGKGTVEAGGVVREGELRKCERVLFNVGGSVALLFVLPAIELFVRGTKLGLGQGHAQSHVSVHQLLKVRCVGAGAEDGWRGSGLLARVNREVAGLAVDNLRLDERVGSRRLDLISRRQLLPVQFLVFTIDGGVEPSLLDLCAGADSVVDHGGWTKVGIRRWKTEDERLLEATVADTVLEKSLGRGVLEVKRLLDVEWRRRHGSL